MEIFDLELKMLQGGHDFMEIIDLELKMLQSGHDFKIQGRMTLKI